MANRYSTLNGPSKIKDQFDNINVGFDRVQGEMDENKETMDGHIASLAAHVAEHISYSGDVVGAHTAKHALDALQALITNLIVNAGDSGPEALAARVSGPSGITYPTLKTRLDTEMQNLIDFLAYMPINGGDFDGGEPGGPLIDGGTY